MRLIPPYLSNKTKSTAEQRLFQLLKNVELPGSSVCIHSVNLPEHLYKSAGELDFLLISQQGLYVLEVKGGGVTCQRGIWEYEDRWGNRHRSSEGPFNQAMSGMYSLRKRLGEIIPSEEFNDLVFGYGVVFPDCDFNETSLEWNLEIILNARQCTPSGIQMYFQNMIAYWHRRFSDKPQEVSPTIIGQLIQSLRPDFELAPALHVQESQIEARLLSFTKEQYDRLEMIEHEQRILIQGGAGTGKTFLAREAALRLSKDGKKTALLCFNPILAASLRRNLESESLSVTSIHRLMMEYVQRYDRIPEGYYPGMPVSDPWFLKRLAPAFEAVTQDLPDDERFDALVLDEGQDILSWEYIAALDRLIRGGWIAGTWRIFYDPHNQSAIFGKLDTSVLQLLNGYARSTPRLSVNCRNTDPIVLQTKMITGADLAARSTGPGPDVVIRYYESLDQSVQLLEEFLQNLQDENISTGDITILSTLNFEESCASRLPRSRVRGIKILKGSVEDQFPSTRLTFSSVVDFKGLENRYIFLIDVVDADSTPAALASLYVGMTRARVKLWLLIHARLRAHLEQVAIENLSRISEGMKNVRRD